MVLAKAAFATPVFLSRAAHFQKSICRTRDLTTSTMSAANTAKTVAITGASGGIGAETAKGLIRTLPNLERLYLCCRDLQKAETVAQPLRDGAIVGKKVEVEVIPLELANVKSVVDCAKLIDSSLNSEALDVLICNAGIMAPPLAFADNGDGEFGKIEKQYLVNHLSHALLTDRLLKNLKSSDGGRVVFVSSTAVKFSVGRKHGPLIAEKSNMALNEQNYEKWACYGDSKLAMSLYAKALSTNEDGIESVSLHPGVVQTELSRYLAPKWMQLQAEQVANPGLIGRMFSLIGFKTAAQGAELNVELASAQKGGIENGAMYYAVGGIQMPHSMIPLLENDDECNKVFEDTKRFVEWGVSQSS